MEQSTCKVYTIFTSKKKSISLHIKYFIFKIYYMNVCNIELMYYYCDSQLGL